MTEPLPFAYKALRRSLDKASDEGTRERLRGALDYVALLYGLRIEPTPQDDGDLRRRKLFAHGQHRLNPRLARGKPDASN